jgi:thioredoxin-related protein
MMKHIVSVSIIGLLILTGCSPESTHENADASTPPPTNAPPVDLTAAVTRARAENKLVLLDFTGSDWCPPCIRLHKEVFSRPEFHAYAESNLVFLTLDFPRKFALREDSAATNKLLATNFKIEGFPTLIVLDGEGKEVWRTVGFSDGLPKELMAALEAAKPKAK